jgi:phage terminase large subunit-like protein
MRFYVQHEADAIVAESNQGGEMVRETLINASRDLPMRPRIQLVHAKVGKRVRAEPVVSLYEQGKVHHVGMFGTLEDQQCVFPLTDDDDQVDALVHAITAVAPAQRRGMRSY